MVSNMDKKIKSFTIIELMVTIILSSLVVLLTYTFYDIIAKQFYSKKQFYQRINEVTRLHLELQDEFEKSETIRCADNEVFFVKSSGDSICYEFSDSSIIRKRNDMLDTIFLEADNIKKGYFDKDIVFGVINKLCFTVKDRNDTYSFDFYKEYASDILMRKSDNDVIARE